MPNRPPDAKETDALEAALDRLRRALVQGQVAEAEDIAAQIAGLSRRARIADRPAGGSRFGEWVALALEGIGAILAGDNRTGISHLNDLTSRKDVNSSVRWAGWLWTALAARGSGDLASARKAAGVALDVAEALDGYARSTTLCALGEITALLGRAEEALGYLDAAQEIYKDRDDRRGLASVLLTQARILAATGQGSDSVFAANLAQALDTTWGRPVVFLVQRAIVDEDLGRAGELLDQIDRWEPRPPEADRLKVLLEIARKGEVPLWLIREYLGLRDAPPNDETVGKLEALTAYRPAFLHLREELAWKLLRLGRYAEAAASFDALTRGELDPDMHSSVLLGLGSLASAQQRHRQPAARVRAAVSAIPAAMKDTRSTRRVAPAQFASDRSASRRHDSDRMKKVEDVDGRKAVFSGALQTLSVADVLDFLGQSRRTGTLVVSSESGIGAVYLRQGRISGAASPACDNIGRFLLSRGDITEQQLEAATAAQKGSPDRLLGAIIVEQGSAGRESLREALTGQVFAAIRELFTWTEGHFSFTPDADETAMVPEIEVLLDPQHVLLEVARQVDEQTRKAEAGG